MLRTLGQLVQGNALTSWSMVIAENFDTDEKKNAENAFEQAIALYLESLVGLKYIGDQVVHQLREQKKPVIMLYHDFERRCQQLLLYVTQHSNCSRAGGKVVSRAAQGTPSQVCQDF